MASQLTTSSQLEVLEIQSYSRGCHAYMDNWTPAVGEMLLVRKEPTNIHDPNAVAVYREGVIVGHVPYNLAPRLSAILQRDVNNR